MLSSTMSRIPKLPEGAPRSKEGWQLFEEGLMLILSKWDLFKSAVVEEVESSDRL